MSKTFFSYGAVLPTHITEEVNVQVYKYDPTETGTHLLSTGS